MRKMLTAFLLPAVFLLAALMISTAAAENAAPEWADVVLNERGFLDEGEYMLEDADNGHWMYVSRTLRIQIEKTWEQPEKIQPRDANQEFWCYTAEIWCDTEKGELPVTLWADPENPGNRGARNTVAAIAAGQQAVLAVSTDLFTARDGNQVGIVIRNGQILYDAKAKHQTGGRPSIDTLALYSDGHADSFLPTDKSAEEYLSEGAIQVYTFGPVLLRDGEIPEEVTKYCDRNLNPMHALGTAEPGHYIDILCEGRLKYVNGSTGVMMETLAHILRERGCTFAVCLDGGDSAVMVFMGTQLNTVPKIPSGRVTCEALAFGVRKDEKANKNLDTVQEE